MQLSIGVNLLVMRRILRIGRSAALTIASLVFFAPAVSSGRVEVDSSPATADIARLVEEQIARSDRARDLDVQVTIEINNLEKEIGARLLERTKPRLKTTPAGEALAEHARRILQQFDQAKAAARNAAAGERFQLQIGIAQSVAQPRIARLLARCRIEDAKVAFHVSDASTQELLISLDERLIDVALAPFVPPKVTCGLSAYGAHLSLRFCHRNTDWRACVRFLFRVS